MRTIRVFAALSAVVAVAGCSPQFDSLPLAPPGSYTAAEKAIHKGDFAAAESGFQAYLSGSSDPTYRARAYYRLAQAQYAQKKYLDARASLDALLREFPDEKGPQIPSLSGDIHYALGQPVEAVLDWEQAWSRASDQDREFLRPRMQKAMDDLDASEAAQAADLLTVPEVRAMLAPRAPEARPVAVAPRAAATEPDVEQPVAHARVEEPVSSGVGEVWTEKPPAPAGLRGPSAAEVEAGVGQPYLPENLEADRAGQPAIACLLPLTGPDRAAGRRSLNGLRLAFDGSPYRLAVQDTGSDPEIAKLLIRKVASDPSVLAAVGPSGEADASAVAPLADQLGVPILLLSQQGGFAGRFVLQAATTRRQQVAAIVHHATHVLGLSRFAVLHPDDDAGRAFAKAFADEIAERNATLVGTRAYRPGQTDFEREGTAVGTWSHKDELQAVFIPDAAETATRVAAAVRRAAPTVALLGSDSWNDAPVLARAGGAVEGAVFAASFHPSGAADAKSFADDYRERAGDTPTGLEAQAYDAGVLLRRVLEHGAATRAEVLSSLQEIGSYDGAGRIHAGPGAFEREPLLLRVRAGALEEISG